MKPCAVIFDRDDTLIENLPYLGEPSGVRAIAPRASLDKLRALGIPLAVVSNQSGIGRGFITQEQVEAVNRRVEELLGPFDLWLYCPHHPEDDCECRKPKPKLILEAAQKLNVDPACCVVIGDKVEDVEAARNAGARGFRVGHGQSLAGVIEEILSG